MTDTKRIKPFLVVKEQKDNEFESMLSALEIPFATTTLNEFVNADPSEYENLLFTPGYFQWEDDLPFKERVLAMIKKFRDQGKGFYGEYIQSDDYLLADAFIFKQNFPPRQTALERVCVMKKHYITRDFDVHALLPVRHCSFLPGQKRANALLSFASVLGTHKLLGDFPPVREVWPALLSLEGKTEVVGEGGVSIKGNRWIFATFELSKYREKDFPLPGEWRKILARIVLYLIPEQCRSAYEKKASRLSLPGSGLYAGKVTGANRKQKYGKTLSRVISWYTESGVMPEKDGSQGVFEGFRSYDHKLIPVYRSDCNTESALALFLYGKLSGKTEYRDAAENIFSFLWKKGWQDTNPSRATCGLWKFYDDFESYTAVGYPNDNGEAGRALFMLYHWTGKRKYFDRAMLTAEKFYQLKMHLNKWRIEGGELNRMGISAYLKNRKKHGAYSANLVQPDAGILFLYAYKYSGDKKFLAVVEESFTSGSPRILDDVFLISFLYALTKKEVYLRRLQTTIDILKKNQAPCGALIWKSREMDSELQKSFKNTATYYGLSEVNVRHAKTEPIVDQLYVNSKAALNLYSAYKATRNPEYRELFFRVMDFLAQIQINSADKRLNGAWMRAFDYKKWDYYGSNGDLDWGPYCIESGWTNAWIAIAVTLYLQKETLF